ncbi:MAG: hypothetical protein K2P75_05215 [Sphingobacteriaceae bacterium]|nr:hypothetical protein [Sphingobacteriaceae bacterium]
MKTLKIFLSLFLLLSIAKAQNLKLKPRKINAISGSEFVKSIADSSLTLENREKIIFNEIKQGNVPDFLRKLKKVSDSLQIDNKTYKINYYVLPDYFAIGSNDDFFYVPMTPILAQKVATNFNCSLPTKKMVDLIYANATIKLKPQPIPPTNKMSTIPVFIAHNDSIKTQLEIFQIRDKNTELIAGNKKDIIISNKIYGEKNAKVVIYGWHKLDGKPIQPVYNKHLNTWADYSHGTRLVQDKVWVNGKKTSLAKVLASPKLNILLSDEGEILKPFYPITGY